MKVAVVGLGSMGQRRTRLIKQYDSSIEVFGIDTMPERCAECQEKYGMKTFASIPDLVAAEPEVSCIFISTGPLSHNPIIKECIKYGLHVFTEINLVADGYEENIAAAREKGVKLFLSSTFLYRDEVAYIKKACDAAKQGKLNYIYHIGQYLPNWHPWEDYRKVFYANPRTNGCREIMAIDMPWILDIFGPVKKFSAMKSKNTDLDIAFNDNVYIMMEHENGNKGVFVCDVVTPKTERDFEVYGENFFLSWDGSATGIREWHADPTAENPNKVELTSVDIYGNNAENRSEYASFVVENAYLNEIKAFFAYVKEGREPVYTFEKDKILLDMISEVEK